MRWTVAVGIAGLVLLGTGGISKPDASSALTRLGATPQRGPLLGIVHHGRVAKLVRVDPLTLRAFRRPVVPLGAVTSWATAPDRSRVAVGRTHGGRRNPRASVRVVRVREMRAVGDVQLGRGDMSEVTWIAPNRVLSLHGVCCGSVDVVAVDVSARRIVRRAPLRGEVIRRERTRDALVLLVTSSDRIEPVRLVLANSDGELRSVVIERIWGGRDVPDDYTADSVARYSYPALAVDPDGNRAFVISFGGDVAEVDLASLSVAYHTLEEPSSLFGRFWDWFEPEAHGKASEGPSRHATWLGEGLLALTGKDEFAYRDQDGSLQLREEPVGLKLVDTRDWTVRTLDENADYVRLAGDLLLATKFNWDSATQTLGGMGVAGYAVDGTKRFHLFEQKLLFGMVVYGTRAYLRLGEYNALVVPPKVYEVVDLSSGRVLGTRTAPLPELLVEG
jgi:hypothetical protein